ncbi:hypothetical protein, conserved [Leishmania tarentolae]|uniref:Uncharacterized protein n=1 Tax=Leishmania tarentolae TaxID=5689 RepID=A0A640K9R1_LEITA|nr:hypothetical protein, conserved [Leishmania tarentolae]
MFLFRRSAESMEYDDERDESICSTMDHANGDTAAAGERTTSAVVDNGDILRQTSGSAESLEEAHDAPHTPLDGTVPPPDLQDVLECQPLHDDDLEADMASAAPAASAPAPSHGPPLPPMSRTCNGNLRSEEAGNITQRNRRYSYNSHFSGLSPRSASGISRGRSHSLSGLSAADMSDVYEQQYRRCTSVVKSARALSARRASSVNGVVGVIDDCYTPGSRPRSSAMTESERIAVDRMMENECRRQEAAERSAQFTLAREATIVEKELAREKAAYSRRMRLDEELNARLAKSSRDREERINAAAEYRQKLEHERLSLLYESMMEKETRHHFRNPYTLMAAQRRYSLEMRSPAAIAPQRRASFPSVKANGNTQISPRSSEGITNGTTEGRGTSSPSTRRRSSTPSIAKDTPRQCLPLSAWKKPEQPRRESRQSNISARHRCLSPKDWRPTSLVSHTHQWH